MGLALSWAFNLSGLLEDQVFRMTIAHFDQTY